MQLVDGSATHHHQRHPCPLIRQTSGRGRTQREKYRPGVDMQAKPEVIAGRAAASGQGRRCADSFPENPRGTKHIIIQTGSGKGQVGGE